MPSGAKFAIQGFLYQFNKTLLEILTKDNATAVTIEGIVEDIDLTFEDGSVEAIQCKYHESREAYSPSLIHKPLLQMIDHYVSCGSPKIRYKLFIHVPQSQPAPRNVTNCEIDSARSSKRFKKLNEKIDAVDFDGQSFQKVCALEFGPSLDELKKEVVEAFKSTSLPTDSIETLFYPNAINAIVDRSIKQNVSSRTVSKPEFLEALESIRKTAISRWTLALKTRESILRTRREQLKTNLSKNSRNRCLLVPQSTIAEFDKEIVLFVQDFIAKYHFKPNHEKPPTFCLDCDANLFLEIRQRLHQKGIKFTTGMEISDQFDQDHFYRQPVTRIISGSQVQAEFHIRITCHSESHNALQHKGFDDMYIVSEAKFDVWEQDVEIESIPVESFDELKFLLGLSDVIR
ncbi:MAG: hypothetical protein OXT68_07085 [Chloroflexota bacterium]|nr:hypothetical protein [Chloroflexota bacterium]